MTQTICGIDTKFFSRQPTPEEFGAIVARWPVGKKADFFGAIGEQIRFTCNPPNTQWQAIADEIKATEASHCDGSASQLIAELHARLSTVPERPVVNAAAEARHPTEAELDKAIDLFSKIVEAASASNHNGEVAIMKAWRAYQSFHKILEALEALTQIIGTDRRYDDCTALMSARAALAEAEGRS